MAIDVTESSMSHEEFEDLLKGLIFMAIDAVNHPIHYTNGSIECIDAIESSMSNEEFKGYLKGNCIKYLWRYRNKGGKEDLEKAQWYLDRLILHTA